MRMDMYLDQNEIGNL